MHRLVAIACAIALYSIGETPLRAQGLTHRVSIGLGGKNPDALSLLPSLSESGRFVAFQSYASNLVPDDTNGCSDVFVRDLESGTTTRVSVSSAGVEGNFYSGDPVISADGRFVTFSSEATNLVTADTNRCADVFVHDLHTHKTQRVSVSSAGFEANGPSARPTISRDGKIIAFVSEATNLVADDKNGVQDVFVRDRTREATMRITVGSAEPDGPSGAPSISADGKFVAFESRARAFGHGSSAGPDVFLWELKSRKVTLVSADAVGRAQGGDAPSISRDGSVVVFESGARLLATDGNEDRDVYAWRTASRELVLASVSSEGACGHGWSVPGAADAGIVPRVRADSTGATVSGDGRFIAFVSLARGLVPGVSDGAEVYVRDLLLGTTRCLRGPASGAKPGTGPCVADPVLGRMDCPTLRAHVCDNGTRVGFQGRGGLAGGASLAGSEDIYVAPVTAAAASLPAEAERKPEQAGRIP